MGGAAYTISGNGQGVRVIHVDRPDPFIWAGTAEARHEAIAVATSTGKFEEMRRKTFERLESRG